MLAYNFHCVYYLILINFVAHTRICSTFFYATYNSHIHYIITFILAQKNIKFRFKKQQLLKISQLYVQRKVLLVKPIQQTTSMIYCKLLAVIRGHIVKYANLHILRFLLYLYKNIYTQ